MMKPSEFFIVATMFTRGRTVSGDPNGNLKNPGEKIKITLPGSNFYIAGGMKRSFEPAGKCTGLRNSKKFYPSEMAAFKHAILSFCHIIPAFRHTFPVAAIFIFYLQVV